jgi:hypothetical protein
MYITYTHTDRHEQQHQIRNNDHGTIMNIAIVASMIANLSTQIAHAL